jgi:hypothetical protein
MSGFMRWSGRLGLLACLCANSAVSGVSSAQAGVIPGREVIAEGWWLLHQDGGHLFDIYVLAEQYIPPIGRAITTVEAWKGRCESVGHGVDCSSVNDPHVTAARFSYDALTANAGLVAHAGQQRIDIRWHVSAPIHAPALVIGSEICSSTPVGSDDIDVERNASATGVALGSSLSRHNLYEAGLGQGIGTNPC